MMNWISKKVFWGKVADGILLFIAGMTGMKIEGWMDDALIWFLSGVVMWLVKETEATKARMETR